MTNREIKFRAWDKRNNKMRLPQDWYLTPDGKVYLYHQKETVFPEDLVLMQFSNLYDKHQKPIFEGDIVKYWSTYDSPVTRYPVVFHDGQFYIKYGENKYQSIWYEKVEVIGNIYENPELIGGTK